MSDGEKSAMDTRRTANSRPQAVTSSKDVGSAGSKYPPRQHVAARRDVPSERAASDACASYRRPSQSKMRIQRPRARGYDGSGQKTEVAKEKAPVAEHGSVHGSWGSKKSNMNHLLNFHFEARHYRDYHGVGHCGYGVRRASGSMLPYNKERFLQANCQFVVKDSCDYAVHAVDPDTLVDWDHIEQVRICGHEVPTCPICLYPPKAAKMTRCGHIYCWSCMLHYLSLDDKSWRKCPICYEAVHEKDLKSVTALETHHYVAGQQITMTLMKKPRGSLRVLPAAAADCADDGYHFPPSVTDENTCYAKLLTADTAHIQSIIDTERLELQQMLMEEDDQSLEGSFITAALSSLEVRQQHLSTSETTSSSLAGVCDTDEESSQHEDEPTLTDQTDSPGPRHNVLPKADVCYTSAFDDTEECLSDVGDLPTDADTVTVHGMTGVASSPALLTMSAGNDDDDGLSLTEPLSDLSLTDVRPSAGSDSKPLLDNAFYFYQAADGQHIYMHAVNIRCLVKQYGSLRDCPDTVTATVVEMESVSMDEDLRRRLRYLSHLPLTCEFVMAELDLRPPLISTHVLDTFKDELNKRRVNRERRRKFEMRHASRVRRQENRQMGFDPTMRIVRSDFLHTSKSSSLPATDDMSPISSYTEADGDEPVVSATLTVAADSECDSYQESSTSPTTLSFAQMLKAGSVKSKPGCEVWPTRPTQPATTTTTTQSPECDAAAGYEHVPSYEASFSDAIQAALDNYDQLSAEVQAPSGGKKKQKNKKKLLFSTSLPRSG